MHIFNLTSFPQKCCVISSELECERECVVYEVIFFFSPDFQIALHSNANTSSSFFFSLFCCLVSRSLISNIEFWRILFYVFFIYYSICPLSLYGLRLSNRLCTDFSMALYTLEINMQTERIAMGKFFIRHCFGL